MAVQDVVVVNGTTLYYEIRGTGPSVLRIAGTAGDAQGLGNLGGFKALLP